MNLRIHDLRRRRKAWSMALVATVLVIGFGHPGIAGAQWATSGTNIYNTNAGNVGIGTTNPQSLFNVFRAVGSSFTVPQHGEVGGALSTRMLVHGAEPGIMFSSDYIGGAQSGTEARVLGMQIGAFTATDVRPQIYYGGQSLEFVQTTPAGSTLNRRMLIDTSGNVGIGTTTPHGKLEVSSTAPQLHINDSDGTAGSDSVGYITFTHGASGITHGSIQQENGLMTFDSNGGGFSFWNGNVGIGTATPTTMLHVVGDLTVTGNIAAKYQDVAEWVPTPAPLRAGTVVVLDPEHSNQVLPSSYAYDTRVAGVISDTPGVLLGEGGEGKVKVATTGRVKVQAAATRQPIRVGDLLVTSDQEGIAMRSEPLDLGGTPIHRPGTLIGKALEPLAEGEGAILVLLSLQ